MNQASAQADDPLPEARIARRKWRFPFIWVVPVVSALVAGYLIYQHAREYGPTVTIRFQTAYGLMPGQTPLRFRGADIGKVSAVTLSPDERYADVRVKVSRSASGVARDGSLFWIVRPQLGIGNLSGLETIISGPYVEVLPGTGKPATQFTGLENSPMEVDPHGMTVVLLASEAGSLRAGVPIYYRGIQVGVVNNTRLDPGATAVDIIAVIRQCYAALVHTGSKFWNVTGLDLRLGLFKGAELNVESLRSLLVGGIAFATPDSAAVDRAADGTEFRLYAQPEKEWLTWAPQIPLPSDGTAATQRALEPTPSLTLPGANAVGMRR